jgi:hypothetical protein
MPVRPRRSRRARNALTIQRFMALTVGPSGGSEPLNVLEAVFREHRRRFASGDWGVSVFEEGQDPYLPLSVDDDPREVGLPGV